MGRVFGNVFPEAFWNGVFGEDPPAPLTLTLSPREPRLAIVAKPDPLVLEISAVTPLGRFHALPDPVQLVLTPVQPQVLGQTIAKPDPLVLQLTAPAVVLVSTVKPAALQIFAAAVQPALAFVATPPPATLTLTLPSLVLGAPFTVTPDPLTLTLSPAAPTVGGPDPTSFRLYVDGQLAATIPGAVREFDWLTLGLATGTYKLELTRVHSCNRESDPAVYVLEVGDGGTPSQGLAPPSSIVTRAIAAGDVALRFLVVVRSSLTESGMVLAPEYEVAEASDLDTILGALEARAGQVVFNAELGPFPHGSTVDLRIRASDGVPGGVRGAWIPAPRVVADSEGPAAPDVLDVEHVCA